MEASEVPRGDDAVRRDGGDVDMQTPDALYRHKQFPEMVCFVRDASDNLRVVVQFHTWSPGAALVFSEEPCFKRVLRRKLQPVLGEDGLQLTIIGQHHVVAAMVRAPWYAPRVPVCDQDTTS